MALCPVSVKDVAVIFKMLDLPGQKKVGQDTIFMTKKKNNGHCARLVII